LDGESRLSIARAKSNIGALFSDLNDWSNAELVLREALVLYREIRDRHGEATTLNNLLRVCLHKGLTEEAEQNAAQAANLFVEARDYYSAAVTKRNLAQIVYRNPKRQDWKEFLSEAIRLFERASAVNEVRQVRRELEVGYGRHRPPDG
jgi:tetratricopeptide (TPR) repeat protein